MLGHDEWLTNITELVRQIADPEEQRAMWFGTGPLYCSPVEVYCQLFDDCTFDLFYETYAQSFSPVQDAAWNELKSALEDYGRQMPDRPDAGQVFRDPAWHAVGEIARRWLAAFATGER